MCYCVFFYFSWNLAPLPIITIPESQITKSSNCFSIILHNIFTLLKMWNIYLVFISYQLTDWQVSIFCIKKECSFVICSQNASFYTGKTVVKVKLLFTVSLCIEPLLQNDFKSFSNRLWASLLSFKRSELKKHF